MVNMIDLPDEMIEHILTFVKDRDIGRCRQVNRRLYQIANDPHMVKRFPHITVDGSLYLKEQAYFTPTLRDRILTTTQTNDLEWLVSRTTPVFREVYHSTKPNMTAWFIIMATAHNLAENIACQSAHEPRRGTYYVNPFNYYNEGDWAVAVDALTFTYEVSDFWSAFSIGTEDNVWSAANDNIMSVAHYYFDNIMDIINDLNLVPLKIGSKCYQISECMMLLAINKSLILSIVKPRAKMPTDSESYQSMLLDDIDFFKNIEDNPWIKQYRELK
jgi:hypothetical protein